MIEKNIAESSLVDANQNLKISSILKLTQNISVRDLEAYRGLGEICRNSGLLWIISRSEIKINRLPNYLEEFTLETYPNKSRLSIYPRQYIFRDKDGNILIQMVSLWALIDHATRKPIIFKNKDMDEFGTSKEIDLPFPSKIRDELPNTILGERVVMSTDIDLNGHMNNTRYMDFVFDLFTNNELKDMKISNIKVNYYKEVYEGDKITLVGQLKPFIFVAGMKDDEKIFELKIE